MVFSPLSARRLVVGLSLTTMLSGCSGQMEGKLAEVLTEVAASVKFQDDMVVAQCRTGAEVKVPLGQLELNLMGLAPVDKLQTVARALMMQCENAAQQVRRDDDEQARFLAEAKRLEIATEGKSVDELRTDICGGLAAELSRQEPARKEGIQKNALDFGCPDPGAPPPLPTGEWLVKVDGEGKKKSVSIRLSDELGGETPVRLAFRCPPAKKRSLSAYIQTSSRVSKRNKVLSTRIGKRRKKFKVNLSKDRKSLFFREAGDLLRALKKAEKFRVAYKDGRGKTKATSFALKGIDEAAKAFAGTCKY